LLMTASAPRTIAIAVGGPIDRSDLPGLCKRLCALLQTTGADVVLCDVSAVRTDAVTIDALARLRVVAGRHGCEVRLQNGSDELRDLLAFMGLSEVLRD
jgi:ABC-type transporter Mla MlaB component